MAFLIPGALLLFVVLLTILPWRLQAERSWRQIVYDRQIRVGASPEKAKTNSDKARIDWGPIDP